MGLSNSLADSETLYDQSGDFSRALGARGFHGFFGRAGGVSAGIYASLNCGAGSDDDAQAVAQNKAIVAQVAGAALVTLHQIHSDICVYVDQPFGDKRPEADAFVTDRPGLALGVLSADCAPVLFYGEKADGSAVIGAAHAGWKGAIGGVLQSCVRAMIERGAVLSSIYAVIGPCIEQSSYEVSQAFFEQFYEQNEENERFFKSSRNDGHYMFDLAGYCANALAGAGVQHVTMRDIDTYANEETYFSNRRATHRAEPDYGRQISVIALR
ncbi:MAG: peptidoglycan editing factor PgeF [Bdellovibrionales bacterium]